MSALMADHRDYADDERQPSLFDVLAPQPARPDTVEPQQPEGAQVVEFPRRSDVVAETEATARARAGCCARGRLADRARAGCG